MNLAMLVPSYIWLFEAAQSPREIAPYVSFFGRNLRHILQKYPQLHAR